MFGKEREQDKVWKGLAAGIIAGLAASWMMNRFQDLYVKLYDQGQSQGGAQSSGQIDRQEAGQPGEFQEQNSCEEQDDVAVKAACAISEGIFDHNLTKSERKIAGPVVHYAVGASVGGLYGAVAELAPEVTVGAGLPFGMAFWLVADETAVPLLGLSKGPTAYPVSKHVYGLASHIVYGLTADVVRRLVRGTV